MDWLGILTYLAGALLCLYLFIFIAVFGGLFFLLSKGLGWSNRKLDWLFGQAHSVLGTVNRYTIKGMDVAAQPEIRATAASHAAAVFVRRLFGRAP